MLDTSNLEVRIRIDAHLRERQELNVRATTPPVMSIPLPRQTTRDAHVQPGMNAYTAPRSVVFSALVDANSPGLRPTAGSPSLTPLSHRVASDYRGKTLATFLLPIPHDHGYESGQFGGPKFLSPASTRGGPRHDRARFDV